MAQIIERACVNHADRRAIGVCVMTGKPICAECSTRYEGVNYSKEGLELLRRQREAANRSGRLRRFVVHFGAVLLCPVLLSGTYFSFWGLLRWLINLRQWSG